MRRSAVNQRGVGSNPTWGAKLFPSENWLPCCLRHWSSSTSQVIPNSCIRFQTILFSLSGRGESLRRLQRVLSGTPSPEFSVSPESVRTRLTGLASRFHFSNSLRMFIAKGARAFQQPIDSGTTAKRTFVALPIHSEVNRLGHPHRRSAIHRQHPCRPALPMQMAPPYSSHQLYVATLLRNIAAADPLFGNTGGNNGIREVKR